MKLDTKKLANTVVKFGGPIVLAALLHRLTTGKLDLKGAVLDAAGEALDAARAPKAAQ